MHGQIVQLSQDHPRYGYRRVTALLRREGQEINAKRVQRVRRKEGLQVSRKQRKLRRLGLSTAQRQRATQANHVWSWDFVEDQTENGTRFRVLTLIDEHTRECLAVHVDWSIRAVDVITVVEAAMARYGVPTHRQRAGVHRLCDPGLAQKQECEDDLHHPRFAVGERIH